jgi:hypothetical protein
MSRLQYLFVPGTRARCRSCGTMLRARLTRTQMLALVLAGAAAALLILSFLEGIAMWLGFGALLVLAVAMDGVAWRRVGWVVADKPAGAADQIPSSS